VYLPGNLRKQRASTYELSFAALRTHSGFASAYDIIDTSKRADSIAIADYNEAHTFGTSFAGALGNSVLITFEEDNGWLNVNGSYGGAFVSNDHQYLAGTSSAYSSFSPASSATTSGRTTLVAADSAGDHSNGTAAGTIEYIVVDSSALDGNRVHFNLDNIGHSGGPDEPDLARINSGSNIDRGINVTQGFNFDTVSSDPLDRRDQFLEVLPSEQQEGGLNVYFSGHEVGSGDAFNNPVTAFGFYLMGREIKRDVFLDVLDTSGTLIHSSVTTVPGDASESVVEYISFTADDDEAIASFSLREAYDGSVDTSSARDIFSIDDLSLQFAVSDDSCDIPHSGFGSTYDEVDTTISASSINFGDHYSNAYLAELDFLSRYSEDQKETITFEADNGWLDVDGSSSATYQFLAGTSTPYALSSPAAVGANARTTIVGTGSGSHSDGTASGTIEYIYSYDEVSAARAHFTFTNVGHNSGPDESDLARLNSGSNVDRGINITNGIDSVVGGSRDQFLEILPSNETQGGLTVSFKGISAIGDVFSNPVTGFGFYLMGRQQKRDVCLSVVDTNGDTIFSKVTSEPSTSGSALVEYITFTVGEGDASIQSFSLVEEFDLGVGEPRDIFSIDNLTLTTSTSTSTPTPTTLLDKPVDTFTPDEIDSLTADDVGSFTVDDVKAIDADFLADLDSDAVAGFTSSQIEEILPEVFAVMSASQIKAITPQAIKGLRPDQIVELTPKSVKSFSSEQVSTLGKETFGSMSKQQMKRLTKDAVTGMTKRQFLTIKPDEISVFKPREIGAIDPDAIAGLKPRTLDELNKRQVASLTNDQLQGLTSRQAKRADGFMDKLSKNQIKALTTGDRSNDSSSEIEALLMPPVTDPLA
jgi:hypothetical protein